MVSFIVQIDLLVGEYLKSFHSLYLDLFFHQISAFGNFFVVLVVFLFVASFLWRRDRRLLNYFVAAVFLNETLVYTAKKLVSRLRPIGALGYEEFSGSLPSGHAAISILLFGYICHLMVRFYKKGFWRDAAILLLVTLVVLIGFSRLYLDVHYLSDVLLGYLLGGVILFFLTRI